MELAVDDGTLKELTTRIVAAYVANHTLASADLATLIATVQASLRTLALPIAAEPVHAATSAVPIRHSVSRSAIVCLECGKTQKTLRRHLATAHDLTPGAYRTRWGLPDEYPMTAPDYAAARSELAKAAGFGRTVGRRRHTT